MRDAYADPLKPKNAKYIEKHHKYLWDPNNKENAQLRGPQSHITATMCADFGNAGNNIQKTKMSAEYISSLVPVYTTHKPLVDMPIELKKASPYSAQQSYELIGGRVLSGFTGNKVYMTNDKSSNTPKAQIVINNMPSTQNVSDYSREIPITKQHRRVVIISNEEHKSQTIGIAMSARNVDQPRVVTLGSVSKEELENSNRILARRCIMGIIQIKHPDPSKDTAENKNAILNKVLQTGDMSHAKEYLGIPFLFSNKYHDSNNNSFIK